MAGRLVARIRPGDTFEESGGERAAAFCSLIDTATLNDLDPEAYLRELFTRIADHPVNRIDGRLPWNLTAAQAAVTVKPAD